MTEKTPKSIMIRLPKGLRENAEKFGVDLKKTNSWVISLIKYKISEKRYDNFYYLPKLKLRGKPLWIRLRDGRRLEIVSEEKPYKGNSKLRRISVTATYNKKFAGNVTLRKQPITPNKKVREVGYGTQKAFRGLGLSYFLMYMAAKAAKKNGINIILGSMLYGTNSSKNDKISVHLFEKCSGVKIGVFKKIVFNPYTHKHLDLIYMQADTAKVIKETAKLWRSKGITIINKHKIKP